MNWDQIVQKVTPHIVKIETQSGHGSGFLFMYNDNKSWCGIATAAHVLYQADKWKQPIQIFHSESNQTLFLQANERVITIDWETDSAVLLFNKVELPLPENLIPLLPSSSPLSIGLEVGWLGFPAIESFTLCFFSGIISARQDFRKAYLIDGVAIQGVSGGPVLYSTGTEGIQFIGTVNAYKANRVTGEALPGLLIAQDVSHFHGVLQHVRSVDEANKKKQEIEQSKLINDPNELTTASTRTDKTPSG
ncbi:MAG: hypothetical protein Q8K00_05540 [Syntrophales bacterium]|nr:hypothetical protein [Syntrophales bacterium]